MNILWFKSSGRGDPAGRSHQEAAELLQMFHAAVGTRRVSSSGPGFQLGTSVYSPCIMKYPSTPSRLMCSCCRSRKDAARERLPRMSSITSACEPPDTAAIRTSTAASWSPAARIFSLGQWTETQRGAERTGWLSSNRQGEDNSRDVREAAITKSQTWEAEKKKKKSSSLFFISETLNQPHRVQNLFIFFCITFNFIYFFSSQFVSFK